MQCFLKRNLEHMGRFASLYPKLDFAKQAVSQLPWGHILKLMQAIDNIEERQWYAEKCIEHGWSRSILGMQIETNLFARQSKNYLKSDNFQQHLPEAQSEHDNKTIGLLLCKTKNKLVADYALQNMKAPIGISEYHLSKALPKDLKTALPSIEEIEAELNMPASKDNKNA